MSEKEPVGLGALYAALAAAQGEMEHAKKDKQNPFFKSSYADLASVMDACRATLAKHGLCVVQLTEETEAGSFLVTVLGHKSGDSIQGRMAIRPTKADPQGYGSAMTYARRYALAAIVGVGVEDDDGNAGSRDDDRPKKAGKGDPHACPECGGESVAQKYPKPGAERGCRSCGHAF